MKETWWGWWAVTLQSCRKTPAGVFLMITGGNMTRFHLQKAASYTCGAAWQHWFSHYRRSPSWRGNQPPDIITGWVLFRFLTCCTLQSCQCRTWSQMHNLDASGVISPPAVSMLDPSLTVFYFCSCRRGDRNWVTPACVWLPSFSVAITVLKIYELSVYRTTFWPSVGLIGDAGRWNSNVVNRGGRSFILVLGCIMWHIYSPLSQSPSVGFRGD